MQDTMHQSSHKTKSVRQVQYCLMKIQIENLSPVFEIKIILFHVRIEIFVHVQ